MEIVRVGLAKIIAAASGLVVCASTGDYDDIDDLMERHRPHLVIADPFEGVRDGLAWLKQFSTKFAETKILVASSKAESVYAERSLRAGASGYWMKTSGAAELVAAIHTVLGGELYVSERMALLAVHRLSGRPSPSSMGVAALSDRELHVFTLIGAGHGAGRIAEQLGISRKTVEAHCEHIKLKLGYLNAEALREGARQLLGAVA